MACMKKLPFAAGIAVLLTIIVILSFSACKKDYSAGHINIIGKWTGSYKYDNTSLRLHMFRFNADSTVEVTVTLTEPASGKLLGYQYKSNGRFHLNGESLKLYQLAAFYNSQDKSAVPPENLVPLPADTTESYTIKVNNSRTSFYFDYPPCPPNASCLAKITYNKQ
jgi:hypothetical protein